MLKKKLRFWRVNSLLILFLSLLLIITGRLFQLQVLEHSKFSALAEGQHWGQTEIPAARGKILSRDGFPLVENQAAYLVYGEPPNVKDARATAEKLAEILWEENPKSEILSSPPDFATTKSLRAGKQILNSNVQNSKHEETERIKNALKQDLQWVALAHKVSPETKSKIESLEIEGIGFEEEPKRFYPEGTLAAHLLGFVGSNEQGQDQGYYGLEGFYNGDLRGRPGKIVEEKDASGQPIAVGGYKKIPAEDGRDLMLTLDRSLQFLVEQRIAAAVEKYGAKSGSVVVMEPQSGAILAMANYPTYTPSTPYTSLIDEESAQSAGKSADWTNPAISETYEPGSVLKALTMSAGINTKTVEPQTTMQDNGPITVSGYTVDNWDGKHHGEETMIEVLQHSNNCGAAWVGQQLGAKTLRDYFLKFGLGEPLGIDLEDEDTGIVKEPSDWRPIDLANAAFGQGVSATPLQLVSIFSTIVNNGVMMKPYLVSEIREDGKVILIEPKKLQRVLSAQSADIIKEMLTAAVEGGESKFYNLKTFRVAGKTGTAQIPIEGRYDPTKTNTTFIGFLPSYPNFVMLVLLRQPTASIYAAETAVPTWMEIVRELTVYYGIEPDK